MSTSTQQAASVADLTQYASPNEFHIDADGALQPSLGPDPKYHQPRTQADVAKRSEELLRQAAAIAAAGDEVEAERTRLAALEAELEEKAKALEEREKALAGATPPSGGKSK